MWGRWALAGLLALAACSARTPTGFHDGLWHLTTSEYAQLKCAQDNATFFQKAYESLQEANAREVDATAYSATVAQCGKTDRITASGRRAHQGRTLAVSRDLRYLLHRRVRLLANGVDLGVYTVEDLMPAHRREAVDVYMDREDRAAAFGVRRVKLLPL